MAITGSSSSLQSPEVATPAGDLVVGLATYNHVNTAGAVAREVRSALGAYGPALRWTLIVADGGSSDGTLQRIREEVGAAAALVELNYRLHPSDALTTPYHGLAGRARAVHALLGEARSRQASACIVVDAQASGLRGESINRLIEPLAAQQADFVSPAYVRHPLRGALVHGILYPLFRALYGVRLRWPIGMDFGCSASFIEAVMPDPIWDTDAGQVGIDPWLAATAVCGNYRIGEAVVERQQPEERRALDLSATIAQVIGFFFTEMERRVHVWQRVRGSRPLARFGESLTIPDSPDVDLGELVEAFRLAQRELEDVWAEVLPPLAILQWRRLATAPVDAFRVDDALWARTVYDFAMGHRLRVIARDHLLRSLAPLYLGWLASFVREVRHLAPEAVEAPIERLCLAFEAEKPYLISQWRWPERFRPVKLRR